MFDLPQVPGHVLPIAFFVLASGGCSPQALPTRLSCGCHHMNKANNCHKSCFVLSIWVFYYQDGQSLAHVAQRGCGVSISGDNSTQPWANCSGWPPIAVGLEQWPPEVCSNLHILWFWWFTDERGADLGGVNEHSSHKPAWGKGQWGHSDPSGGCTGVIQLAGINCGRTGLSWGWRLPAHSAVCLDCNVHTCVFLAAHGTLWAQETPRPNKIKPTAAIGMDIYSQKRKAPQLWGQESRK